MSGNKLHSLGNVEIVGLTIYGEARGEPVEGQIAVGCVIRNRFHALRDPDKRYHDICLAHQQFSCWNGDDPNRPVLIELADKIIMGQIIDDIFYKQALFIADGIVNESLLSNIRTATNYMVMWLFNDVDGRPDWANRPRDITKISKHVFFTAT